MSVRNDAVEQRLLALEEASTSSNELPPPDQMATAWGAGFTMVVGCYVIARAVGAVLNFIDSK